MNVYPHTHTIPNHSHTIPTPKQKQAFEKGDPKADENVRSIITPPNNNSNPKGGSAASLTSPRGGQQVLLQGAVQACLGAALGAWDAERQQRYLQAAAYGALRWGVYVGVNILAF